MKFDHGPRLMVHCTARNDGSKWRRLKMAAADLEEPEDQDHKNTPEEQAAVDEADSCEASPRTMTL